MQLLLHILKQGHDGKAAEDCRWFSTVDWEQVFQLARHHRVTSLLYTKLKSIDGKWIPTSLIGRLQEHYQRNAVQMLALAGELERINVLFKEHQIRSLCLKGPVLASLLYGDLSLRTSSDLDLLIPIEDLQKGERLLESIGYSKDNYIQTILGDWKWRHHHVTYFHPELKYKIELHWRLHPGPTKEPAFDELWERKQKSSQHSSPIYFLGNEDLFLFLVCHGARHGWSRLRWLIDIDRMTKQDVDWRQCANRVHASGFTNVVGQALILTSKLLGTSLPTPVTRFTRGHRSLKLAEEALFYLKEMINLHNEPLPQRVSRYHKQYLFSLKSAPQKALFILSFLYPYPIDHKTLPLPEKIHFLYFPLRPLLCAWRKLKGYFKQRGTLQ
ncbi:nucleotidyltransferase domain-containing protein [Paenibacillus sp. sgz302251]|uniref:nucleotidyltransferase domain-containing protein n=1 Tax=Paenibacillus sp. sgz302251 TaxID=3414493 RepID=UPI003C7CE844